MQRAAGNGRFNINHNLTALIHEMSAEQSLLLLNQKLRSSVSCEEGFGLNLVSINTDTVLGFFLETKSTGGEGGMRLEIFSPCPISFQPFNKRRSKDKTKKISK